MPRRPAPEALSPRALARLRSRPRAYVPTELDLEVEPRARGEGQVDAGWPGERAPSPRPVHLATAGPEDLLGDGGARGGRDGAAARERSANRGRHVRATARRGWVRLPAAFVGARWQPGRAAVVGVVVVVVLAVAVFGLRVAWARSASEGTVIAPGGGARAGPTGVTTGAVPVGAPPASVPVPSPGSGAGAADASGATPEGATPGAAGVGPASGVVVVHVVGQVRHPGVRRLPVGSRVADAVEAAGGATGRADLALVNLARVLVDGEQVRVPKPGEEVPVAPVVPGAGGGTASGGPGSRAGPVSLNTADLAALDSLPGVGPVLAQRILDWRTAHGRFASVDELGEVSGIGDKLLAQLSPLVTL